MELGGQDIDDVAESAAQEAESEMEEYEDNVFEEEKEIQEEVQVKDPVDSDLAKNFKEKTVSDGQVLCTETLTSKLSYFAQFDLCNGLESVK